MAALVITVAECGCNLGSVSPGKMRHICPIGYYFSHVFPISANGIQACFQFPSSFAPGSWQKQQTGCITVKFSMFNPHMLLFHFRSVLCNMLSHLLKRNYQFSGSFHQVYHKHPIIFRMCNIRVGICGSRVAYHLPQAADPAIIHMQGIAPVM